ncbi:hypothetical protein [Hugenholtzia roseola]|uniref:hypothetical protein n=1 Tax=Hugenholtzia roseola TaxID=1002 RepID=UPI000422355D|nr:hypothetical protein [Hugenholtzia roseola]
MKPDFAIFHEDDLILIHYQETRKYLHTLWRTTYDTTEEAYKATMRHYVRALKELSPRCVLIDARPSTYTIPPEVQEWISENVYPVAPQAGVEKLAFVVTTDEIAQLSIEQAVEDGQQVANFLDQRFFDDPEKAENWLLE